MPVCQFTAAETRIYKAAAAIASAVYSSRKKVFAPICNGARNQESTSAATLV